MALDEPKEDDAVYEIGGIQYIIRKTLMNRVRPVKIHYSTMGFRITSSMDRGAGCATCSSTAGCS